MSEAALELVEVNGVGLQLRRTGSGPKLLFLEPHVGLWKAEDFLAELARHYTVLVPSHPGFEESPTVDHFNAVEDLAYLYLDLFEQEDLEDLNVVGASFGAWVALSVAIKDARRFRSLVLIDPVGAHFGGPEDEDIADIFSMGEVEFAQKAFADEEKGYKNYPDLSDEELLISSRNREAAARYAWMPCLYDPKMKYRLHRVAVPTLVLWGEADRITARDYAERMAAGIPAAKFATLPNAGHFPYIEQPGDTVARIRAFTGSGASV